MKKNWPVLSIALKIFRRDWLRGDLVNLIFALAIAMASVSVIYLIIDRVESATNSQASQMLGADLVLTSPRPLNETWLDKGDQLKLIRAETVEFASVVVANNQMQLSAVKAVSDNYPLLGNIELENLELENSELDRLELDQLESERLESERLELKPIEISAKEKKLTKQQPPIKKKGAPAKGKIWVEPRIATILKTEQGTFLELGYADFEVSGIILLQPGQGSTLFNIAPSAIIGLNDLPATKVIQPGSRVTYRYLFVGHKNNIAKYKQWLETRIDSSQRLVSIYDESPMGGSAISRSKKYISLSGILTLILLGVSIALSANLYAQRQFDMSALMRCFGMNNNQVLSIFLIILTLVALLGIAIGAIIGVVVQMFMVDWLSSLFGENLPSADYKILLLPTITSFVLLFGFAMPALIELKNVPPMRVLRRQLHPPKMSTWFVYSFAVFTLAFVMVIQVDEIKLLLSVFLGLAVMAIIFSLISLLLIGQIRRFAWFKSAAINFSLKQLNANKGVTLLHLLAFSSTVFVIALVIIIRTELLSKWQQSLSDDTPNHFMVNISEKEVPQINQLLTQHQIKATKLYPMVRGRVTQINGENVNDVLSEKALEHNSLKRELNMTWTFDLPLGNKMTDGDWTWGSSMVSQNSEIAQHKAEISVETKMAEALGLKLGDELTFSIGAEHWTAKVVSFRSIDWQTFTPNFYIIAKPGSLNAFSPTFINAFRLNNKQKYLVDQLTNNHPTAIIIELDRIFKEIEKIIQKVTAAIDIIMLFIVAAGIVLLWATMEHSFSQKIRQSAILRTLGASRCFITASFRFEFLWLALISSFVALLCIELVSYFLYQHIFNINFSFHLALWWQMPFALYLLMMVVSWRGVNRITLSTPLSLLK